MLLKNLHNSLKPPYSKSDAKPILLTLLTVIGISLSLFLVTQKSLIRSNAAGAPVLETESGTISGNVTIGDDPNASGGKYVQLGQIVTGVTPTAAPTTPPVSGSLRGWQVNASNSGLAGVGIDKNTLPLYSGSIPAGSTITQKKLLNPDLSAGNITLDRVWVVASGTDAVLGSTAGPITIKDSDIDSQGTNSAYAVGVRSNSNNQTVTILRVNIYGFGLGVWLDGPGKLQQSYIHDLPSIGDPATTGNHVDGITRREGTSRFDVIDNFIDARTANATGAVLWQPTFGFMDNTHMSGNLFAGGGYTISLGNKSGNIYGSNLTADNNRWLPKTADSSYYNYVGVDSGQGFGVWTNNYVNDPTKPNNQGAVVAQ